ncbi:hypothetical protein Gasu2_36880 [Galdieria sulphuraria]|nr:hypothetical protein Gasu2_36880 [Galdieria sulphuraria]
MSPSLFFILMETDKCNASPTIIQSTQSEKTQTSDSELNQMQPLSCEETSNIKSSTNVFNFEVSNFLREAIFKCITGRNSLLEAANFEYRTVPSFIQLLDKLDDSCRGWLLEDCKFVNLNLPWTRSSLLGHLEVFFFTEYPKLFEML